MFQNCISVLLTKSTFKTILGTRPTTVELYHQTENVDFETDEKTGHSERSFENVGFPEIPKRVYFVKNK